MPELPEVRTVAHLLNKKVKNKTVKHIWVKRPKMLKGFDSDVFNQKLDGATIIKVSNVGKYLTFFFDNDVVLVSHLRMEGKYHTDEWDNPKHDYVTFEFCDNSKLYYNDSRQFGTFDLKTTKSYLNTLPLSKLGKEPQETNPKEFYNALQKRRIAIKTAILDQTLVLGIGNIYANEILWELKIHPETPSNKITFNETKELLRVSADILDKSTALGGTTIHSFAALDKQEGQFQNFLKVHFKAGSECPRCKTKIEKTKVNGRGTYFCPKEQIKIV